MKGKLFLLVLFIFGLFAPFKVITQNADKVAGIIEINDIGAINSVTTCADLVVNSPNANPVNVPAGSTTSASCVVKNIGTASAGSSTLKYYLSQNQTWDASDVQIGSDPVGSLNVNGTSSESETLTIPANTPPGTWFILFRADAENMLSECNESNNVNYKQMSVLPPASPDLVVISQNANPVSIPAGNTTSASCVVKNSGNASAGSSTLKYYLSQNQTWEATDFTLGSDPVGSLNANGTSSESETVTIPANTTQGTWYILFKADAENTVAESNENNNVSAKQITVLPPAGPDLVVISQNANPLSIPAGNTTSASCVVKNSGNASAGSSTLKYYLSSDQSWEATDFTLGSDPVGSLNANGTSSESETVTIPANTTQGTWYILFKADAENTVAESNENNNVSAKQITVLPPAGPDLVVSACDVTPETVAPGGQLNSNSTVKNIGNASAGSSTLIYYLSQNQTWDASDVPLGSDPVGSLNANGTSSESETLTIPANTTQGTWYILFKADAENTVAESDENNNICYKTVIISGTACPDLIVLNTNADPLSIPQGSSTTASCTIKNQGNSNAVNSTLKYYLSQNTTYESSDLELGSDGVSELTPGSTGNETESLTIPANTTAGPWYILFRADANSNVPECDETNNIGLKQITVIQQSVSPDLAIIDPSVSPTSTQPGGQVTLSCKVKNQGNGPAGESTLKYFLSQNTSFDTQDILLANEPVSSLQHGASSNESETVTIPSNTSVGTWYILFFADAYFVVPESNENNNISYVQLTISSQPGGLNCSNFYGLTCGDPVNHSNSNGNSNVNNYNCAPNWYESGPEKIYQRVLSSAKVLTATLSNHTADLDVFILGSCSENNCLAYGNETATYTAQPGTYWIVVDGFNGASGNYTLTLTCQSVNGSDGPTETIVYHNIETEFAKVFPNPTKGFITLELFNDGAVGKTSVEIFNSLGERVVSKDLNDVRSHEFSLVNYPSGIYIINVNSNAGSRSFKIVKE